MKFSKLSGILCLLSSVLYSCNREALPENEPKTEDVSTISVYVGDVESDTKTALDNLKVNWVVDDEIHVYADDLCSTTTSTCVTGGNPAKFTFTAPSTATNGYYSIYPKKTQSADGELSYSPYLEHGSAGYEIKGHCIVFSTQRALAGGFDPSSAPMFGKAGLSTDFHFVNIASLLKFTISGNGIAKVVISDNAGTAALAGSFVMECKDSDADGKLDTFLKGEETEPVGTSSSITLLPPTGSVTFPAGTYCVAVCPDVTCTAGLSLASYDASGNVIRKAGSSKSITLNRGSVRSLGSLNAGSDLESLKSCPVISSASVLSSQTLRQGVDQTTYTISLKKTHTPAAGDAVAHIIKMDPKAKSAGIHIRTLIANNSWSGSFKRMAVRNMALCFDKMDKRVIAVVPADYYDASSLVPKGPVKMEGTELYGTVTTTSRAMTCVKEDNTMYIAKQNNYEDQKSKYSNINGAYYLLVNNGTSQLANNDSYNKTRYGENAVGYASDGTIYFVTIDPLLNTKSSVGATYYEIAQIMASLGCYRAALNQSAGHTGMIVRDSNTNELNMLGDGCLYASPLTAWAIYADETPSSPSSVADAVASCAVVKSVESSEKTVVKTGAEYWKIVANMSYGWTDATTKTDFGAKNTIYVAKINLPQSGMSAKVLMNGNMFTEGATTFTKARLDDMAKSLVSGEGKQVQLIVNGDFFDETTYAPRGIIKGRGTLVKNYWYDGTDKPQQGRAFVGFTSDKQTYIGGKDEFSSLASQYSEAIGAGLMMLKDGQFNSEYMIDNTMTEAAYMGFTTSALQPGTTQPRSAIGYDNDGNVYVVVVDGRNPGTSKGASYPELCEIFKSLGCVRAVNLDGGSSSQLVDWTGGTEYSIVNDPRDAESEGFIQVPWRQIVNGIGFVDD